MAMERDHGRHDGYVFRVRDSTQQYLDHVLRENQKLREFVSALEEERERRECDLMAVNDLLDHQRLEREQFKRQLDEIESQNQFVSEQYRQIERQNNDLANLYVASYRLHETLDPREVISVIEEIVVNLIGSEEMAIFELNDEGSALTLLTSIGVQAERFESVPLDSGLIGRAALSGECMLASHQAPEARSPEESDLTACVPLKVDERVTGAIAVFQLLQQKPSLEALDFELLDLLATHAATALHCSRALADSHEVPAEGP
jgi:nitrate/nitrite-specific signal transduction histidine kinase